MCQASNFFNLNKVVLLAHSVGTDVWMYRQAVYPSQSKLQQAVQDDQVAHHHGQLPTMQCQTMYYRLLLCKWCCITGQRLQVHFTNELVVWHDTASPHRCHSRLWPAMACLSLVINALSSTGTAWLDE